MAVLPSGALPSAEVVALAERFQLEGIMSKRKLPYRSVPSRDWFKVTTAAGAQQTRNSGGCLKSAKIIRVLAPTVEGPGKRRHRAFRDRLKARRHLQGAERVRRIIVSMSDGKWAKNFLITPTSPLKNALPRLIGRA